MATLETNFGAQCTEVSELPRDAWQVEIERLYTDRSRELARSFMRISRDTELAHDTLHESVASLLQQSPGGVKSSVVWLRQVGTNRLSDHFRKQTRRSTVSLSPAHSKPSSLSSHETHNDDRRQQVHSALKRGSASRIASRLWHVTDWTGRQRSLPSSTKKSPEMLSGPLSQKNKQSLVTRVSTHKIGKVTQ